jgi:hypothetical protein
VTHNVCWITVWKQAFFRPDERRLLADATVKGKFSKPHRQKTEGIYPNSHCNATNRPCQAIPERFWVSCFKRVTDSPPEEEPHSTKTSKAQPQPNHQTNERVSPRKLVFIKAVKPYFWPFSVLSGVFLIRFPPMVSLLAIAATQDVIDGPFLFDPVMA